MRYGRAARRVSHASVGAWRNVLDGLEISLPGCAPRRGFCLMRLMRGIHDIVGHALTFGEVATGVRPSTPQSAARSWTHPTSIRDPRYGSSKGFLTTTSSPRHTSSPTPTADPSSPATLPEQVRSVMRLLPNPIVVCTSTHGDTPRGMTMSSFTSLTLSPIPLISFNIATPSRTLDAIKESRHFNIHIMAGDAGGVAVADRFTRGNSEDVFKGLGCVTEKSVEANDASKVPLLKGDGVLYALRCRLLPDEPTKGLMKVRDHVIVVGEVLEVIPGSCGKEFGLAYADRKYRQIGGIIERV